MGDVTEVQGLLYKSGQVTLDSSGNGVITLDPASARERWEVTSVVVRTNQAATATVVPVATVGKNTSVVSQLSQANNHGQSWSGNQDIFTGQIDISPADYFSVLFTPPPGQVSAAVSGSGSVTSPGTFAIFVTLTVAAGTYLITWTPTLAGSAGAGDANNFGLTTGSGTTLAAPSVNAGAAGSYPQASVTHTFAAADTVLLKTWSASPTAGAVYGGTVTAGSVLSGVLAYATVTGKRYTRRA